MQMLPYWVTGAGVLAAIVIGIVVVYIAGDRRLRRRESPAERLTADPRA